MMFVLEEPPSANRWWRKFRNRMVLSDAAREYKAEVAAQLLLRRIPCIPEPEPVSVSITWYRSRKSGDLDKRLGVLLDALQLIAYENDSQVVELHAERKDDKNNPRVEVTVRRVAA